MAKSSWRGEKWHSSLGQVNTEMSKNFRTGRLITLFFQGGKIIQKQAGHLAAK